MSAEYVAQNHAELERLKALGTSTGGCTWTTSTVPLPADRVALSFLRGGRGLDAERLPGYTRRW